MGKVFNKTITIILLVAALTAIEGCYLGFTVGAGRMAETHKGKVEHVVLIWLKEPGNRAVIQKLIEISGEFKEIPGVLSVSAGRPVISNRPAVDATFDVGVVIEFESVEALQNYEKHPVHTRAVREYLAPNTERLLVYDIER